MYSVKDSQYDRSSSVQVCQPWGSVREKKGKKE